MIETKQIFSHFSIFIFNSATKDGLQGFWLIKLLYIYLYYIIFLMKITTMIFQLQLTKTKEKKWNSQCKYINNNNDMKVYI